MVRRPTSPGHKDDRYMAFIGLLKTHREKLNLSQQEIADRLGWHQQYVSRIELGERRLDVVELVDYAEALGADLNELVAQIPRR